MKKKNKIFVNARTILTISLMVIMTLAISSLTYALSLGLTPGDVTFNNVLAGGYAETDYSLSTDSSDNITIRMTAYDDSPISSWITYEPLPDYVTINRNKPFSGKIKVSVPSDVSTGTYSTLFKMSNVLPLPVDAGDTVSQVVIGIIQNVTIDVTNDVTTGCSVYRSSIAPDAEEGSALSGVFFIENSGNTKLDGRIIYTIQETSTQKRIDSKEVPFSLLSTQIDNVYLAIDTQVLPAGQYDILISIPSCSYNSQQQLIIYKKGQIKIHGTLTNVLTPVRMSTYDPIVAKATFINDGERDVQAVFQGRILLDDEVVNTFTTAPVDVAVGSTSQLTYSYKPSEDGRYIIDGFVSYGNYQTDRKSSITTIRTLKSSNSAPPYALIVMGVIIIALLVAIIQKKKHVR